MHLYNLLPPSCWIGIWFQGDLLWKWRWTDYSCISYFCDSLISWSLMYR